MTRDCRWLVVRQCESAAPEVYAFDNRQDAEAFYDMAAAQWTETFLCPVLRGIRPTPALGAFRELLAKLKRSPAMGIGGPAGSVGQSLLELIELLGEAVEAASSPGEIGVAPAPAGSYRCSGTCGGRAVEVDGELRCAGGCEGHVDAVMAESDRSTANVLEQDGKFTLIDDGGVPLRNDQFGNPPPPVTGLFMANTERQRWQVAHHRDAGGCTGKVGQLEGSNVVTCDNPQCGWQLVLGVDDGEG